MKSVFPKTIMIILALIMMLGVFTACSSNPAGTATGDNITDAAEKATPDTAAAPTVVTIEANGRHITFEDATGKSVQQLLDQAGITLNEGDTVSIVPNQVLPGDITFQVLRQHIVTVTVAAKDPSENVRHTAVLMEGTVADAIAAVGVELAENHVVNFELNKALEDGMEIMISGEVLPATPIATEPSEPSPDSTTPTEPNPSQSGKTIVSIEVYEDCDGSGHGIQVITYSDGTQEEVMF